MIKNKVRNIILILLAVLLVVCIILVIVRYATQDYIENHITLPVYTLPDDYAETVDSGGYLGQPDMVRTRTGKFITVYPEGHGYGSLRMQTSNDGKNWTRAETPSSWQNSQETPTIYALDKSDGSQTLIVISGKPYWTAAGLKADGFQFSTSNDDGVTWSEFETVYSPMDCIVAMSSLTQLKENGEFVDKWLGTFHTHEFVNYKTILSFDEQGKAVWSKPEPILADYREIEQRNKLCELEIIRDDDNLIMFTRNEARGEKTSMISLSTDEGVSWSEPKYLPADFSGDRFKAEYDEISGKVLISYRQIVPFKPHALSFTKFMTFGWVLWVGGFDDLYYYLDVEAKTDTTRGDCLIILGADTSGDCGYSGIDVTSGVITAISYGYFASGNGGGNSIRSVQFSLSDFA